MLLELRDVSSSDALAIIDLVSDDPNVRSCERESGDDPNRLGIAEISVILAVILAAGTTARFIADLAYEIRQRFRPFLIVDCSESEPKIHVLADVPGMRGEIVIKSRDGEQVRLAEGADSTQVASAVVSALKP